MKFKKLNSSKEINVNINKYLIKDWDNFEKRISGPERKVLTFLKPYWKNHYVLREFRIPGSKLRIDVMNIHLRICLEVSPEATHSKFNKFMHGSRIGYLGTIKRDLQKEDWIKDNGFKYVCLMDEDLNNLSKEWFKEKYDIDL